MFDNIDSQEEIALAQMVSVLAKYLGRITSENGNWSNFIRCAGLSALDDKYVEYLQPYYFNGSWKNPNPSYNPLLALNEIFNEISSNKTALLNFLNEFFKNIMAIEDKEVGVISNYLEMLGYRLEVENIPNDYGDEIFQYKLLPYTDGVIERQNDISFIISKLNIKHNELVTYYKEAISTYGHSEYKSCIDNCRTLFEMLFKKEDSVNEDYAKGILNITQEQNFGQGVTLTSQKKIFEYWLEKKKGANRYRLFITFFSAISGMGIHGEVVPSKADALMCLRITEDILIWYFQTCL